MFPNNFTSISIFSPRHAALFGRRVFRADVPQPRPDALSRPPFFHPVVFAGKSFYYNPEKMEIEQNLNADSKRDYPDAAAQNCLDS
jgi:hypothetical protein